MVPEGRIENRSEPMLPFTPETVWMLRLCPPFPFQVFLNEQERKRFLKPFHRPSRGRALILSLVSVSGAQVCSIQLQLRSFTLAFLERRAFSVSP